MATTTRLIHGLAMLTLAVALVFVAAPVRAADDGADGGDDTYTIEEVLGAATGFFGATTEGLATVIEKAFSDLGRPNGYIAGEEISGAFIVGLRYGRGALNRKGESPSPVYWQGPSIGFDFGGNGSKVFTLVYDLPNEEALFQRYPGVDGSFYFVAGLGMNYQRAGDVTLAPIRTGVGLRMGANVGYLHYGREHSLVPF
jgi:hypothetical protein